MFFGGGGIKVQDSYLDMQLTGKVVLFIVVLFLLTVVYRLYKFRLVRVSLWDRNIKVEVEEEVEGFGQFVILGVVFGALYWGSRRRRGSKGVGVSLDCSWESSRGFRVLEIEVFFRDLEVREIQKSERKGVGEEASGQRLGSDLVFFCGSDQEVGTVVGGKFQLF